MAGEKILLVDDRRENILFLANDVLRPNGYEVITAMDGERGLHKALEEKPDLIITDMRMPKMNGAEMIRAMREAGHNFPVILTTFHGSEGTAIEAFRAGATDYIIKPFTVDELLQAVERALSFRFTPLAPPSQKPLDQRLVEPSNLHDICKAIISLLDLETVFSRIVEAAVYLSNAEEGYLMLMDTSTSELYLRATYSYGDKQARGFRLKVADSLIGQVVSTGKPLILKPSPSGDAEHKLKTGHLMKSLLAVPIKGARGIIGVLSVDNVVKRAEFTKDDSRQLSILAEYAAIAIQNARLYKQAQEQARAVPEEAPLLTEAEIAERRAEAAHLTDQLRALAGEAEKLAQRLQPVPRSTDEAKG